MEVSIKIDGQVVSAEVTVAVCEYLDQAKHKNENLAHEQCHHWAKREFDDYIVAHDCSWSYYETPEEWFIRKETLQEIMAALESCTKVQRHRFFFFSRRTNSHSCCIGPNISFLLFYHISGGNGTLCQQLELGPK